MPNENSEFLYHYTNVSSLAMIFQNQNVKFNPLTVLDDSEEENIQDEQKFGKYCFVSSWTDDEKESIPMWNMYTNLLEGVRIKLPKNPFQEYFLNKDSHDYLEAEYIIEGDGFNIVIPPNDFVNQDYFLTTFNQTGILKQVNYTNDINDLFPKIKHVSNGQTHIELGKLGIYKNEYWSFQREWRYILKFFPFGYKEMHREATENNNQELLLKLEKAIDLPFNYYFLKLNKEKFEQMQITLSPKINEGNKTIVKLLVENYNPHATIFESKLVGRLR